MSEIIETSPSRRFQLIDEFLLEPSCSGSDVLFRLRSVNGWLLLYGEIEVK